MPLPTMSWTVPDALLYALLSFGGMLAASFAHSLADQLGHNLAQNVVSLFGKRQKRLEV